MSAASLWIVDPARADVVSRAPAREYATVTAKRRLHQHRFRQLVVRAYRTRCAVCHLKHENLLDAAHILEDKHERGLPEVPNGLALYTPTAPALKPNPEFLEERFDAFRKGRAA